MMKVSEIRKRLHATKREIERLESINNYPDFEPSDVEELIQLHEQRMKTMIDQLSVIMYVESKVIPGGISKN